MLSRCQKASTSTDYKTENYYCNTYRFATVNEVVGLEGFNVSETVFACVLTAATRNEYI